MTPLYSKMKNAELLALLVSRGLDSTGTKIEMVSRLVMQDADDEKAWKATEDSVRKASGAGPALLVPASAPGSHSGTANRDGRNRHVGRKELEKRADDRRSARNDRVVDERDQDGFVRDLITTSDSDANELAASHLHGHDQPCNNPLLPDIVVKMTPKGARGRPIPSTLLTKPDKNGTTEKNKRLVMTGDAVPTGMFGSPFLGAVLVFVGILAAVLMLGAAVELWRDGERGVGEVLWELIVGSVIKGRNE